MAKTIPGGKYLSSDKKTLHDANGKPITGNPASKAEAGEAKGKAVVDAKAGEGEKTQAPQ